MKTYLVAGFSLLVFASATPAEGVTLAGSSECQSSVIVESASIDQWNEKNCSVRGVRLRLADGRLADVPDPGWIVTASALTAAGYLPVPDVTIARSPIGDVAVIIGDPGESSAQVTGDPLVIDWIADSAAESADVQPSSTSPKCDNYAYNIGTPRWISSYTWYRKSGISIPYSAIAGGINAMADGTGQCSNLSNSATASYQGTTSSNATISSSGTCQATDFTNTVGDGTLPAGTLASTCTYKTAYEISYADVKFNTATYSWYTGTSVTGCSGSKYDAQGVMAHESGHVFGLGHVANSSLQVMKTSASTCETTQRLLGPGDLTGMKALYP